MQADSRIIRFLIIAFLYIASHTINSPLSARSGTNKRKRMSTSSLEIKSNDQNTSKIVLSERTFPVLSTVTPQNYDLLLSSNMPILLNIKADWCSTYGQMAQSFKEVAQSLYKKCVCAEIEVDCFEDSDETIKFLHNKFGVSIECIPTVLIIKENKVQARVEETLDKQTLKERFLGYLK